MTPIYRLFNYFYGKDKYLIMMDHEFYLSFSFQKGILRQYESTDLTLSNPTTKTFLRAIYIIGILFQNVSLEITFSEHEGKQYIFFWKKTHETYIYLTRVTHYD
jgi:hypothetical protein